MMESVALLYIIEEELDRVVCIFLKLSPESSFNVVVWLTAAPRTNLLIQHLLTTMKLCKAYHSVSQEFYNTIYRLAQIIFKILVLGVMPEVRH